MTSCRPPSALAEPSEDAANLRTNRNNHHNSMQILDFHLFNSFQFETIIIYVCLRLSLTNVRHFSLHFVHLKFTSLIQFKLNCKYFYHVIEQFAKLKMKTEMLSYDDNQKISNSHLFN